MINFFLSPDISLRSILGIICLDFMILKIIIVDKGIFCILRIVGNTHLNVHSPTHTTAVHKTTFLVKNSINCSPGKQWELSEQSFGLFNQEGGSLTWVPQTCALLRKERGDKPSSGRSQYGFMEVSLHNTAGVFPLFGHREGQRGLKTFSVSWQCHHRIWAPIPVWEVNLWTGLETKIFPKRIWTKLQSMI